MLLLRCRQGQRIVIGNGTAIVHLWQVQETNAVFFVSCDLPLHLSVNQFEPCMNNARILRTRCWVRACPFPIPQRVEEAEARACKQNECLCIGRDIALLIAKIELNAKDRTRSNVLIGAMAPLEIPVHHESIYQSILADYLQSQEGRKPCGCRIVTQSNGKGLQPRLEIQAA